MKIIIQQIKICEAQLNQYFEEIYCHKLLCQGKCKQKDENKTKNVRATINETKIKNSSRQTQENRNLRPTWAMQQVSGHSVLYIKTIYKENKNERERM